MLILIKYINIFLITGIFVLGLFIWVDDQECDGCISEDENTSLYPKELNKEWENTIYRQRNRWIERTATSNLSKIFYKDNSLIETLVVVCEGVEINNDKVRFKISDPYKSIWTEYFGLNNFPENYLRSILQRVIVLDGLVANGKFIVKAFRLTVYFK